MILMVGEMSPIGLTGWDVPLRDHLSSNSADRSSVHDILGSVDSLIGEIPRSRRMVVGGEGTEEDAHFSESPEAFSSSSSDKGRTAL